jgi:hypothetical protein|tara:strand:- start:11 stop:394 length:384 start_codon:yes stop_codon:yes gene_type:complete
MSITRALDALGIINYKLEGDPTTEEEFNTAFVKITGADIDGVAIESNDPEDFGVTWSQIQDTVSGLTGQELIDLRSERNRLIALTDWTQMEDIPQATRDTWKPYRQALRDITSSATSLDDVTWPTKP